MDLYSIVLLVWSYHFNVTACAEARQQEKNLTCTSCSEGDLPTRSRNNVIGFEGELDNIGFACDDGRQGFADTFASNNNVGSGVVVG